MKKIIFHNDINNDGTNIEALHANDVLSARTLNRPLLKIVEDREDENLLRQALLKHNYTFQNENLIVPNAYEEFKKEGFKIDSYFNQANDLFLRIPTGLAIFKDENSSETMLVANKPNCSLFERQLANAFNFNIDDFENDINVSYEINEDKEIEYNLSYKYLNYDNYITGEIKGKNAFDLTKEYYKLFGNYLTNKDVLFSLEDTIKLVSSGPNKSEEFDFLEKKNLTTTETKTVYCVLFYVPKKADVEGAANDSREKRYSVSKNFCLVKYNNSNSSSVSACKTYYKNLGFIPLYTINITSKINQGSATYEIVSGIEDTIKKLDLEIHYFKNIKADGDTFKASYNDSIKMYTKKFEIENENINEKGTLDITNIKTTIGTNSNCQTTIDDYNIISVHNGNSVSIGEGIIEATGHVKCSYIETTSARDKKTEIVPTTHTNAVEEINKINIVDFYFKNDTERKNKKIGFIAEDTDITFSVDNKHFDVNNCIGMLLKSVQELSSENKILREKIEKLENR